MENTYYKDLKNIKQAVEKLLSGRAGQHDSTVGKIPQELEPSQIFTFALPFKEALEKGTLRIYYPARKTKDTKNGIRISLVLAMGRIGEVRTDFYYFKKNLDITFFVRNDEIKSIFQDHIEKIRASLQNNFNALSLNISISEDKIDAFDFENIITAGTGMVNLRV